MLAIPGPFDRDQLHPELQLTIADFEFAARNILGSSHSNEVLLRSTRVGDQKCASSALTAQAAVATATAVILMA